MLALLGVYRIGAHIPTPGIDSAALANFFSQASGTLLGFLDLFTGGNFRRLTIFALGIMTTLPKAKEVRPLAEKMITLGKRDSLHARRQLQSFLLRDAVAKKVFDTIAPRFADRNGGYSRIIKLGNRKGDGADLAILELIGSELEVKKAERAEKAAQKAKGKKDEKEEKEEE